MPYERKVHTERESKNGGWIYIYKCPSQAEGHVKIGKTNESVHELVTRWHKCGLEITLVQDIDLNAFDNCSLVDRLIMAELHNQRKAYKCHVCKTPKGKVRMHNEWYHVDQNVALKHIQKWRSWILLQEPIDRQGALTPFWRWKIE